MHDIRQPKYHGKNERQLKQLLGVEELPDWADDALHEATKSHHKRMHGPVPESIVSQIANNPPRTTKKAG